MQNPEAVNCGKNKPHQSLC